jgi:hypothetical protein
MPCAFGIGSDPDIHVGYIFFIQTYENQLAQQWTSKKLSTTLFKIKKITPVFTGGTEGF